MKTTLFLLSAAVLLMSCNTQKRKNRTVKDTHPPKAAAAVPTAENDGYALAQDAELVSEYSTDTPDPRLHDIWALERMNGKKGAALPFDSTARPIIEINTRTSRFLGSAGCNTLNGTLLFEKEVLRFTDIATTRMACPNLGAETEFLETLQKVMAYTIKDLKLYLATADSENALVFKKID